MKRCRLSPLAELDLEEIWLYVAQDSGIDTADRLIEEITKRFALLATHPDAGRLREDIAAGVRSFPVKNYLVYYKTHTQGIMFARVLHGKRDQAAVLDSKA